MKTTASLQLQNLEIGYSKEKIILSELNLSFSPGLTGLIGVNGIGKSTLLKTIAGLLKPVSGKVLLDQKESAQLNFEERARMISVVLTEKVNDPYLSVFDIVSTGRSPYTGFMGKPSAGDISLIEKYLGMCGILHLSEKKSSAISDGEKQKTMIARALAQETPVMLLDEPSTFLDFRARYEIMDLLLKISQEENKIILFSSHDIEMVFKTAAHCLVLLGQKETALKSCAEIINSNLPEKLLEGSNLSFDRNSLSIAFKK
jgi:iron complex transport system ATP-binding protein